MNNREIEQVKETVCLGVIWDENLNWRSHVAHVVNTISNSIGIIWRKSRFYLKNESLRILYFTMIYPYLQYCNLVWASTYPSNLSRLVILQKKVIRIINKSDFNAYTSPIFKALHLFKFQDIRNLQISQFMFSISNNNLPIDFQDMFTLNNQTHSYNTRSSNFFHVPRTRTKLRQFSIKYQGPTIFNSLSNEIKLKLYLTAYKLLYC